MNHGVERRERDTHVRWMRRDAAVESAPRIACIRLTPSIASHPDRGRRLLHCAAVVVEVGTAGSLHQIAADGCHVANLSRGAEHDRLRQKRIALADSL